MGMVRTAKVISLKFYKAMGPKHPALDTSDRAQGTAWDERDLPHFFGCGAPLHLGAGSGFTVMAGGPSSTQQKCVRQAVPKRRGINLQLS